MVSPEVTAKKFDLVQRAVSLGHGIKMIVMVNHDMSGDAFQNYIKDESRVALRVMWSKRHKYTPTQIKSLRAACADHGVDLSM